MHSTAAGLHVKALVVVAGLAWTSAVRAQPGMTPAPAPTPTVAPLAPAAESPGAHKPLWEMELRGQWQRDGGGAFAYALHLQPKLFERWLVFGFRAAFGTERFEWSAYAGVQYFATSHFVPFVRGYAGANLAADEGKRGIYTGELGLKLYAWNRFYLVGTGGYDNFGGYAAIGFGFGPWGHLL